MARKTFSRSDRIAEQIQRELAEMIRTELKDPRVGFITLTSVQVTRDYSHAKVYYTVMNSENIEETQATLERAAGFLRGGVARVLKLFTVPQLHFVHDKSIEHGMYMHDLISKIAREEGLDTPENPPKDDA